MDEETLESEKMRHALADIAKEIQKFNCSKGVDSGTIQYDLLKKIKTYKCNLGMKKKQTKYLTQSLRISCVVAKLLISSKAKDILTLKRDFLYGGANSTYVSCKRDSGLVEENSKICEDNFTNLEKLINNSYLELQKNHSDVAEESSVQNKVKKILFYCQDNWIKLCTERSKCDLLEQRNRYLTNKISILESNLKSIAETQKGSRNIYLKEKDKMKFIEPHHPHSGNRGIVRSSYENSYVINNEDLRMDSSEKDTQNTNVPLKRHLILVRSILVDQNDLLKELKELSDELA